jgi:hypothetical protein
MSVSCPAASGIQLCDGIDRRRFSRLLDEVWCSIPSPAREEIRSLWCDLQIVVLVESSRKLREARVVGDCEDGGSKLRFYGPALGLLSDDDVRAVIAHELAHVLQKSRGQFIGVEAPDELRELLGDELARRAFYADCPSEREADELANSWGFPQEESKRALAVLRWDELQRTDRY